MTQAFSSLARHHRHAISLLCSLVFFSSTAWAESSGDLCAPDDVSTPCQMLKTQEKWEKADKKLNQIYKEIFQNISRPKDEYIDYPSLKAKFIKAQRQWIAFRTAECDAWYLLNQAGTGRNVDYLECMLSRTHDRIQQLNAWKNAIPSM